MNLTENKSYYLFSGKWIELYSSLLSQVDLRKNERFSIWQSKENPQAQCLIIMYNAILPRQYEQNNDLVKISESGFAGKFMPELNKYRIFGFNEFQKRELNNSRVRKDG